MQVFVSAVSREFEDIRRAVADQISGEDVTPIHHPIIENWPTYKTLQEKLRDRIKPCDAVFCLVGEQYGAEPKEEPSVPRRSYTQLEYEVAREEGKDIFLFFAEECLPQKPSLDGPVEEALQQAFVKKLRGENKDRKKFKNKDELLLHTKRALDTLLQGASERPLARQIGEHFPTPLARLFHENFGSEYLKLRALGDGTLQFLALLSAQDSALHGGQHDVAKALSALGPEPGGQVPGFDDWCKLLAACCEFHELPERKAFFIPEMRRWHAAHNGALETVRRALNQLEKGRGRAAQEAAQRELRQGILEIFSALELLKGYVLIRVTGLDGSELALELFRGDNPRSIKLELAPGAQPNAKECELFLLSLGTKSIMPLSPVLWSIAGAVGHETYGWLNFSSALRPCLTVLGLEGGAEKTIPDDGGMSDADLCALLRQSFGRECVQTVFGICVPVTVEFAAKSWFTDEAWLKLDKSLRHEDDREKIIDGRFVRADEPFHRGKCADLYKAEVRTFEPSAFVGPSSPVIHLLRGANRNSPRIRTWFKQRERLWSRLQHPAVLHLHSAIDAAAHEAIPCLVVESFVNGSSLEELYLSNKALKDSEIEHVLVTAAEVCEEANRNGIYLMALPRRHILRDVAGAYRLTGFDTAVDECPGPDPLQYFSDVSVDRELIAPEVADTELAATLDIFALGALLAQLKGWPHNPMRTLPPTEWREVWRCLAFHCLAADPNMRFQTASHLLMFLNNRNCRSTSPPTVCVHNGRGSFSITKFPITNREYMEFCKQTNRPTPRYGCKNADSARFCGPLFPVTGVSWNDANEYCTWLSNVTKRPWHLPSEIQWIAAASNVLNGAAPEPVKYPWGNGNPDSTRANCPSKDGTSLNGPTVVGAFPAGQSVHGCFDMIGNVREWCADDVGGVAVVKGGSFLSGSSQLTLTFRSRVLRTSKECDIGFRAIVG